MEFIPKFEILVAGSSMEENGGRAARTAKADAVVAGWFFAGVPQADGCIPLL